MRLITHFPSFVAWNTVPGFDYPKSISRIQYICLPGYSVYLSLTHRWELLMSYTGFSSKHAYTYILHTRALHMPPRHACTQNQATKDKKLHSGFPLTVHKRHSLKQKKRSRDLQSHVFTSRCHLFKRSSFFSLTTSSVLTNKAHIAIYIYIYIYIYMLVWPASLHAADVHITNTLICFFMKALHQKTY